jgi:hypothetical protein
LDAFLRRASRIVEDEFGEKGEIPPSWFLVTASGQTHAVVMPFPATGEDPFADNVKNKGVARPVIRSVPALMTTFPMTFPLLIPAGPHPITFLRTWRSPLVLPAFPRMFPPVIPSFPPFPHA